MRIIGDVTLYEVFQEWAVHECGGRLRPVAESSLFRPAFEGAERGALAMLLLGVNRVNVVLSILEAQPARCMRVEMTKADIPRILTMGAVPLRVWAASALADAGDTGRSVRGLAAQSENIMTACLGIARDLNGEVTLFDGMHRSAGWVAHLDAGRDYPLIINVVFTRRPAPAFELPSSPSA